MRSGKTAFFKPWRWKIIFQLSNSTSTLYRESKRCGTTTVNAHNPSFASEINRLNTLLSRNDYDKGHWGMCRDH